MQEIEQQSKEYPNNIEISTKVKTSEYFNTILDNLCEKFTKSDYDVDLLSDLNKIQIEDKSLIQLYPSVGVLKPYEGTVINILMELEQNTSVNLNMICEIHGGEKEMLRICGKSAEIGYKLSENNIEFGRIVHLFSFKIFYY